MTPELKRAFVVTAAVAAASVVGAGEASAQVTETEVYQLATVAGQPLPAVVDQNGDCREELHSATLTLATDGTWTLESHEQEVCGNDTDDDQEDEDGTYRIEGDVIHFMDDDGDPLPADDDADELEYDRLREATRTENGLRLVISDQDTVLEFRR